MAKGVNIAFTDAANIAKYKEQQAKIKADRQEASRLASAANKRAERLSKNGLTDSPAYREYVEGGRFSVRGKTHNEVQHELARLRRFMGMETSTIKGYKANLKQIADNTGIEYSDFKELQTKSAKFFELQSKVEQYLRTVEDIGSAIGYQKIWEAINSYTKTSNIDLSSAETNIDDMIKAVTDALTQIKKPILGNGWYSVK